MTINNLTYEQYSQLKERKQLLERLVQSYTIYGMTDPPLKSEEEIEEMKKTWRAEISKIEPILEKYKDLMIGKYLAESFSKK